MAVVVKTTGRAEQTSGRLTGHRPNARGACRADDEAAISPPRAVQSRGKFSAVGGRGLADLLMAGRDGVPRTIPMAGELSSAVEVTHASYQ